MKRRTIIELIIVSLLLTGCTAEPVLVLTLKDYIQIGLIVLIVSAIVIYITIKIVLSWYESIKYFFKKRGIKR